MHKRKRKHSHCQDCGAGIGETHFDGCGIERCLRCGGQKLSCSCEKSQLSETPRQVWSGEWPFVKECRELNLWSKPKPNGLGWVKCNKSDPEASEDLNALYTDFVWDCKTLSWKPRKEKKNA